MKKTRQVVRTVISAGICIAIAAGAGMPAYAAGAAAEKDENVYATLEQDGSVSGIYVVNEFSSETGGTLSDYGDYTSVKNLTDQSEICLENGHITAEMPKGKFYYQGNLDSGALPWEITIQYFLDGDEVSAGELAGKSGALKIRIQTKQNPSCNASFFEHYLLQATVVLNTEICTKIQAEGATAGNVGVNRQLVYTILPGEEGDIEITAEVQNFEMDSITFQGVPFSLAVSEDMLDELDLSDQTKELMDAVAQLDDGVGELKEGTEAAADGGRQLAEGIAQLADGTDALNNGGSALTEGTSELLSGTRALESGVNQYIAGVESLAGGVAQYVGGVELLAQGSKQLAPLENLSLVDDAVEQLYQAVTEGDAQQGIPSLETGAESLADGLHLIAAQVKLLESSTDTEQLEELLKGLAQIQEMTAQLAGAVGEIGAAVDSSVEMIDTIEASHQAVLEELNHQIDQANSVLSGSVDSVNEQIDQAISAVEAAAESGTLEEETANQAIDRLQAAKLGQEDIEAIQMPQEDEGIRNTIAGLKQVSQSLESGAEQLKAASEQLASAAESLTANLPSAGTGDGIAQLSQALSAACEGADKLQTGIDTIGGALGQLKESTASFGEAGAGIAALNAGFDALCKNNSLLLSGSEALLRAKDVLTDGLSALTSGTDELNSGAGTLAEGISALHEGVSQLDEGAGALTDGLSELDEGTAKLKDGTEEFRAETDNMDETIREKLEELLDELTDDSYEPVSFLSEQNTNIGLVQFAITAQGIQLPEEETVEEPEQEQGFWDRLIQLFQ